MKHSFKSLLIAALAVACAACSEAPGEGITPPAEDQFVQLTIYTGRPDAVDSRTMVAADGTTPMWSPEDAIGVSVLSGSSYTNQKFTNDSETASEKTSFSGTTAVSDLIFTYYPYSEAGVNANGEASLSIPAVQHPTATSFDGAADLLVGKPVPMTASTTKIENLQFKRVGGFLKIVLKDATTGNLLTGETVRSLSVTAETALAGNILLDIVGGQLGAIYAEESRTVTADYAEPYALNGGAAYLGVYPQTLAEGTTLTVEAETGTHAIARTVTLSSDIAIEAGQIVTLNISISDENLSERQIVIADAFPDPIFRAYVLENIDKNKDGKLSAEEALAITEIRVSKTSSTPDEEKIASLEGIQYFANLTILYCNYNKLTYLDVSKNTALKTLWCDSNQLTDLDVSKNTALWYLRCDENQLTSLDLSKNTALTFLECYSNQLTSLDVTNNTELTTLHCYSNQLTSLDVTNNTALTVLHCHSNQLTSLDVTNNTALTDLWCSSNQLTSLDVSKNTELTYLSCYSNQLTSLDLSKHTALNYLYCYSNQLTSLDLSKNTKLTALGCHSNQLTSLDLSKNTALTDLRCHSNQLTSLDLSKKTALIYLECYSNQLTTLDVSNNTALTTLSCYSNQLTSLDLSNTNLGNCTTSPWPLNCSSMETLEVVYLKTGWEIPYIYPNRSIGYIPAQTKIVFIDGEYGMAGAAGSQFGESSFDL